VNVQVIADPAGRLVWASPTLPGARHDMGAAREHDIIDAITDAGVRAVADTACQGGGPAIRVPQRRRRLDPDTGRYRRRLVRLAPLALF
jgi:DDE superfamily endonuclease